MHLKSLNNNPKIPYGIEWNLTWKCNLNCTFCSIADFSKTECLNYKPILANIIDSGCICLSLSGGEPLFYPKISEIIQLLYEKRIQLYLSTNGILLNDEMLSAKSIKRLDWIRVSIHSTSEPSSKSIMGDNYCFNTVLANISKVKKLNNNISVICILNRYNLNRTTIFKFINDLIETGITKLEFGLLKLLGNQTSDDLPDINYLKDLINEICIFYSNSLIEIIPPVFPQKGSEHYCLSQNYSLSITPDGLITNCSFAQQHLGNAYNDKIIDVWNKMSIQSKTCKECKSGGYYDDSEKQV